MRSVLNLKHRHKRGRRTSSTDKGKTSPSHASLGEFANGACLCPFLCKGTDRHGFVIKAGLFVKGG